jgi:hypothetical protein
MAGLAGKLAAGQRTAIKVKITSTHCENFRMMIAILISFLVLPCTFAFSQSSEQGATEIQIWTAGGPSIAGGRGDTGVWSAGLRYGWVLTDSHGPGFLKGRFEYSIDAVPVYLIFQPVNTAYGVGLVPLNLKWNFTTHRSVVPYMELSGGTLFTTHDVPSGTLVLPHHASSGTSTINFTPSAAIGFHLLRKCTWTVEARYLHISNAGLSSLNPGVNTFEMRLGVGKFRASKK